MKPLNSTLINLSNMDRSIPITYGAVRRKRIMELFDHAPDTHIIVNCKHNVQLKHDPDLRKLLKSGKLKRVRYGQSHRRFTYLVLNK